MPFNYKTAKPILGAKIAIFMITGFRWDTPRAVLEKKACTDKRLSLRLLQLAIRCCQMANVRAATLQGMVSVLADLFCNPSSGPRAHKC